jgi:hypothetical protein
VAAGGDPVDVLCYHDARKRNFVDAFYSPVKVIIGPNETKRRVGVLTAPLTSPKLTR